MTEFEAEEQEVVEEAGKPGFALIFELEHVALHSRELEFEVLKGLLADKERTLTPVDYSRFCTAGKVAEGLEQLLARLDAKRFSAAKLEDDFGSGMLMHFKTCASRENNGLQAMLDAATKHEMTCAAITGLKKDAEESVSAQLNLADRNTQVFNHDSDDAVPRADAWLKVAKELETQPRNCFAVVTSGAACKAALAAGMRVIAVPDAYTSFQDFGGAYELVDRLEDLKLDELLDILPV